MAFSPYQRLLPYELAQTAQQIARLEAARADLLYTPELVAARTLWAATPPLPRGLRGARLETVLKLINDLSPRVTGELAGQGRRSIMDDGRQQPALSAARNRQVDIAIDLLRVKIVNRMQGPNPTQAVTSDILLMFGDAMPEAIPRIKEVVDLLRELYNRREPAGYVIDETLPSTFAARAVNTGKPATSYIRLPARALNGALDESDLACALLHEGSHLIADDGRLRLPWQPAALFPAP